MARSSTAQRGSDRRAADPAPGVLWRALRAHAATAAAPCPRCGTGYPIAPACLAPCIVPVTADACPRCAQPRVDGACRGAGCASSRVRRTDAVLGYKRGDVERLILAAKRVESWAIVALGRVLAGWLLEASARRRYDLVLPVPFHRANLEGRPAHPLTAIYLDARPEAGLRLPLDDLAPPMLLRPRPWSGRRARTERERWRTARGTVALAFPTRLFYGAEVLLVDDVLTSGATVSECARVILDEGGAAAVDAVVLARQPWRARPP